MTSLSHIPLRVPVLPSPPSQRRTKFNARYVREQLASDIDVDRIHLIMRNAEHGDCRDMLALYRDIIASHAHLQGRFGERKEAVTGDTLSLQPEDKMSPDDILAATVVEKQITNLASWESACSHLLDSTLYPVSVVEKTFRASTLIVDGHPITYEVANLVPVPYELLDFQTGTLRILDTDANGMPLTTSHVADGGSYIIHRGHSLSAPDNWGGPMRSIVFWWLFGSMDREWWARFLEKYGTPFIVGKYDQADDGTRVIMERALSLCTRLGGLIISRDTEIELKQAAASDTGSAFETFHRIANEIRRNGQNG
jgi:phage gp29-like protein